MRDYSKVLLFSGDFVLHARKVSWRLSEIGLFGIIELGRNGNLDEIKMKKMSV